MFGELFRHPNPAGGSHELSRKYGTVDIRGFKVLLPAEKKKSDETSGQIDVEMDKGHDETSGQSDEEMDKGDAEERLSVSFGKAVVYPTAYKYVCFLERFFFERIVFGGFFELFLLLKAELQRTAMLWKKQSLKFL
jgi:hypothetical protein